MSMLQIAMMGSCRTPRCGGDLRAPTLAEALNNLFATIS
jgi:hypothetical protein